MFGFISAKKNKKIAYQLAEELLLSLKKELPNVFENHQHWTIKSLTIDMVGNKIKYDNISHDIDYVEKNKRKHSKHYNISGLSIYYKDSMVFEPLKVEIRLDNIFTIELRTKNLFKTIDITKIDKSNLTIEEIIYENDDKQTLSNILKNTKTSKLDLLEIDDTYEIELETKKYYTILDMEDGNYIAVNKKGQVFRLHHDSNTQARLINNSIEDFLENYDGHKESLAHLFN